MGWGGGQNWVGLWLPLCVVSDPGPIALSSSVWAPKPMTGVLGAISIFVTSAPRWAPSGEALTVITLYWVCLTDCSFYVT